MSVTDAKRAATMDAQAAAAAAGGTTAVAIAVETPSVTEAASQTQARDSLGSSESNAQSVKEQAAGAAQDDSDDDYNQFENAREPQDNGDESSGGTDVEAQNRNAPALATASVEPAATATTSSKTTTPSGSDVSAERDADAAKTPKTAALAIAAATTADPPTARQQQQPPRPATTRSTKPFVPLPPPKNWCSMALRSNGKLNRIMQAALLKTLLHAIRRGSAEGVKVAIERGVSLQYIDSRSRNLVMLAAKCDTDARLQIAIILCDAGCDINHKDQLGWSCLHYACASGALDVATELIRRGVRVEYNPYGYGPEDFIIPKVVRAKSLLQHTEQLQHEDNVKACWDFFRKHAEKSGYSVKCRSHCDLGKPLRIKFHAPQGHSPLDRIRVVDMNSDVALWLQVSKSFSIPPGTVGSITLDSETLDRPSLYRVFYEKYEPTPMKVPTDVAENSLSIKNLDTGKTMSVGSVNDLVLRELSSTRTTRKTKKLSNSSREAPKSQTSESMPRRLSTTTAHTRTAAAAAGVSEIECDDIDDNDDDASESEFAADETLTMTEVAEHPAVHSITGVYKLVGMAIVSVSTLKRVKANEYEITIKNNGAMGLQLEPKRDAKSRSTRLIVRRSTGQTAAVNPGDCLVAIGRANIEHAGLKHTLWELNEAKRPLVLRFRRGNAREKKSLFASIRKLSGPRPLAAIAV